MTDPKMLTTQELAEMTPQQRSEALRARMVGPKRLPDAMRERLEAAALKHAAEAKVESAS